MLYERLQGVPDFSNVAALRQYFTPVWEGFALKQGDFPQRVRKGDQKHPRSVAHASTKYNEIKYTMCICAFHSAFSSYPRVFFHLLKTDGMCSTCAGSAFFLNWILLINYVCVKLTEYLEVPQRHFRGALEVPTYFSNLLKVPPVFIK